MTTQKTTPFRCKIGIHRWTGDKRDERHCPFCGKQQAYSLELGGWYESDYLAGTNYDGGRHLTK